MRWKSVGGCTGRTGRGDKLQSSKAGQSIEAGVGER